MTVYRPIKVLLAECAAYLVMVAALSPLLGEVALTLVAIAGASAVLAGFILYCIFYDGPPPEPALPIRRHEIIDVKSRVTS